MLTDNQRARAMVLRSSSKPLKEDITWGVVKNCIAAHTKPIVESFVGRLFPGYLTDDELARMTKERLAEFTICGLSAAPTP
eukprot:12942201-Alexandrium_andersonii.AAC.1